MASKARDGEQSGEFSWRKVTAEVHIMRKYVHDEGRKGSEGRGSIVRYDDVTTSPERYAPQEPLHISDALRHHS